MTDPRTGPRPVDLVGVFAVGLAASGAFGGLTNAVNGVVSPDYYRAVLGWQSVQDLWRAVVAQGVYEGTLGGVVLALLYTGAMGLITGGACPFAMGARHALGAVGGAAAGWLVGGGLGVGLAWFSPEFFAASFGRLAPVDGVLAFAWVGGSIQGAWFGGLVGVVLALVVLRGRWLGQG